MTQQSQPVKPQSDQKSGRKPAVLPKRTCGRAGELADGIENSYLETPTPQLGDTRLQTVQRQRIAAQIGQAQGNQHLQKIIRQQTTENGETRDLIADSNEPVSVLEKLGKGSLLDHSTKSRMEAGLGQSVGDVTIHTDSNAIQLAREQQARAFTVGNHIAFESGEYRPGTLVGDAILAHELVHVIQQKGAAYTPAPVQRMSAEDGTLESDANQSAAGAVISLWTGVSDIVKNARTVMRSGLRLQRCKKSEPISETKEEKLARIEKQYNVMIKQAREAKYNVAADNLQHFLDGKGGLRKIPVKWLLSFPEIRNGEEKNEDRFESTINNRGESLGVIALRLKDGETQSFTDHWDVLVKGDIETELYYASGSSTITSTGNFTLTRSGDVVTVVGSVKHNWWDIYDWHPGLTAYVPGMGEISDEDAILLIQNKGAKEFRMEADWTRILEGKVGIKGDEITPKYEWKGP
jgi:hypothetical protein